MTTEPEIELASLPSNSLHDRSPADRLSQCHTTSDEEAATSRRSVEALDELVSRHTATAAVPPPDQGYAWIYLAAAFAIEFLAYGYTYSVGVVFEYWSTSLFPMPKDQFNLALASTLQSGLLYVGAIFVAPACQRYPQHRAFIQYCGLALSAAGIVSSSFVTSSWQLLLTAGFMYPVGASAFYVPAATLLFDWFAQKRGLSNGILYSGTGAGGAFVPIVMQTLLNRVGYKAAVSSLGVGYGLLGSIAILFVRERTPVVKRGGVTDEQKTRKVPYKAFLGRSSFYAYGVTILVTSMGAFLPSIYITKFSVELGLSKNTGTLMLVLMNVSSIFGLLGQGWLSDRIPIKVAVFTNCAATAITAFLLFGFATNVAILTLFSILWGISARSFSSLQTKIISVVAADDPILPPTLYGIYLFLRGLGNLVSGPISNRLLGVSGLGHARFAYGVGNYGSLIIFVGAVHLAGCASSVAYRKPRSVAS